MFIWIWWRIVVLIARFLTHSVKLWWVVVSMFHLALRRKTYQPCKLIFSTRELVIPSRRPLSKSPSRIRMALIQSRIPHTTTSRVAHKLETQRDQERLSKWSKSHLSSNHRHYQALRPLPLSKLSLEETSLTVATVCNVLEEALVVWKRFRMLRLGSDWMARAHSRG